MFLTESYVVTLNPESFSEPKVLVFLAEIDQLREQCLHIVQTNLLCTCHKDANNCCYFIFIALLSYVVILGSQE